MDGEEGVLHPWWAFNFLSLFTNKVCYFCLFHSRYMVNYHNENFPTQPTVISKLGVADKLAVVYTPIWMYRKQELEEYVDKENLDLYSLAIYNVVSKAINGRYKIYLWKNYVDDKCLAFVNEWKDKAYDISDY